MTVDSAILCWLLHSSLPNAQLPRPDKFAATPHGCFVASAWFLVGARLHHVVMGFDLLAVFPSRPSTGSVQRHCDSASAAVRIGRRVTALDLGISVHHHRCPPCRCRCVVPAKLMDRQSLALAVDTAVRGMYGAVGWGLCPVDVLDCTAGPVPSRLAGAGAPPLPSPAQSGGGVGASGGGGVTYIAHIRVDQR